MEYEVTEYKEEGYTARVYRPILTREEREKRLQDAKDALIQYARVRMNVK